MRKEPSKTGEYMVNVMTPAERAKYDPPLAEWLALSPSQEGYDCPACGSTHFGTVNPIGYLQTLRCGDEFHKGCRFRYRPNPDQQSGFLDELAKAARGVETRYATGERTKANKDAPGA
jgi:hypothetical protein